MNGLFAQRVLTATALAAAALTTLSTHVVAGLGYTRADSNLNREAKAGQNRLQHPINL